MLPNKARYWRRIKSHINRGRYGQTDEKDGRGYHDGMKNSMKWLKTETDVLESSK